jgi:hypothetical protein
VVLRSTLVSVGIPQQECRGVLYTMLQGDPNATQIKRKLATKRRL